MSAASDLLVELKQAKTFEEIRVVGYSEYLSLTNLSQEERIEIQEALNFSSERVTKIDNTISTLSALIEDGYPNREKQEASESIILLLKGKLDAMRIAFEEFDVKVTANIVFKEV